MSGNAAAVRGARDDAGHYVSGGGIRGGGIDSLRETALRRLIGADKAAEADWKAYLECADLSEADKQREALSQQYKSDCHTAKRKKYIESSGIRREFRDAYGGTFTVYDRFFEAEDAEEKEWEDEEMPPIKRRFESFNFGEAELKLKVQQLEGIITALVQEHGKADEKWEYAYAYIPDPPATSKLPELSIQRDPIKGGVRVKVKLPKYEEE